MVCLSTFSCRSHAQTSLEKPFQASVAAGGNYTAGNLNQIQAFANGRLSYSGDSLGVDVIANAFRFWLMPPGQMAWRQVGDELTLFGYPYWYFNPNFFVHALARYETSQLHQLDARLLAGGGVGFAPLRSSDANRFVRLSLGAYAEHAVFPGTTFTRDVPHQKGTRTMPRIGFLSNGRITTIENILRLRYLLFCFVDPLLPRDIRFGLDTEADLNIWGPLSFRINANWVYNSVVLSAVQPYDFRATFGLAWRFQA